jgi:coenzyme F420 biosynthesis associated uncharacterized protein
VPSKKPGELGEIFFLDGNIVSAAGRLGIPLNGLRLWIVLHETTHALQFEAHPWLRGYLRSLVEGFTAPLVERLGPRETLKRLAENLRTGGRSLELVMSRTQRDAFDKMQATMSVIEGYSDYVMHHVGRSLVPGYEHLKNRMARSRMHRPPLETAIFRITGLDMKLEQYRLGEKFADAVARRVGMQGLNRVWEHAGNMPTLEEIRDTRPSSTGASPKRSSSACASTASAGTATTSSRRPSRKIPRTPAWTTPAPSLASPALSSTPTISSITSAPPRKAGYQAG